MCPTYSDVYNASEGCTPCVFNVRTDPSEKDNLAATSVGIELLKNLTNRLKVLQNTIYNPGYPPKDTEKACDMMVNQGKGFYVPWEV